jgi:hypothetical protein
METANFFWHGNPLSLYEKLCISSFVKHGFEVNVWSFMDLDVPEGAVLKDASEILPKDWLFKYKQGGKQGCIAAFSDVFRLVLIYKHPGTWWFDTDSICLKDASEYAKLKEGRVIVAGWEDKNHHSIGIGALTITDQTTAFGLVCEQKKRSDELTDIPWAELGPRLVTRYFEKHNMSDQFFETDVFYPIDFYKWNLIYDVSLTESLLDKCKDAYMHHLWNEALKHYIDKNTTPPKGSFMHLMFERYLPEALQKDAK